LSDEYKLYEEAFAIFKKFDLHVDAVNVLLDYIKSISRAHEFADKVNQPEVWSRIAYIYANNNQTTEAIDCFIKANDNSGYL